MEISHLQVLLLIRLYFKTLRIGPVTLINCAHQQLRSAVKLHAVLGVIVSEVQGVGFSDIRQYRH